MNNETAAMPDYVDTETPLRKWYGYNLFILFASLGMATIAGLVIEYEIARLTHPDAGFLPTPLLLDLALSGGVIVLAALNLAVLIFVFMRHLWIRKWMLATTIIGWIMIAVMALVLHELFLPVILPSLYYRAR